jgi:quercetin dioxygenase-like cupin family protein
MGAMSNFTTITHRPVVQSHDAAPTHTMLGGSITFRLRSEDSAGRLAMIEMVIPPGYPGPAMHIHPEFDETFYVLEGSIAIRIGDRAHEAGAGAVVFVPRDTPHAFANPSAGPARMLVVLNPAGFERYFDALIDAVTAAGGVPPTEQLVALGIAHGSVPA